MVFLTSKIRFFLILIIKDFHNPLLKDILLIFMNYKNIVFKQMAVFVIFLYLILHLQLKLLVDNHVGNNSL